MKIQRLSIISLLTVLLVTLCTTMLKAATLSLIDPANPGQSTMAVTPGSNFTVAVRVTGLSASNPVDSFDIQLASLPTGVSVVSILSPLSSGGWFVSGNVADNSAMGYASATGYDFSADTVLLNYTLSLSSGIGAGIVGDLLFSSEGAKNALYDSMGEPISLIKGGLQLMAVIPEPTSAWMLVAGVAMMFFVARRRALCCS